MTDDHEERTRAERRRLHRLSMDRMRLAAKLGPDAVLRLRAEVLLGYGDAGTVPLTDADRERLDRIAVAPVEDDGEWLGGFDKYLDGDWR